MNVLVNAYACSPDMGSEPGMAWNWCVNLANYCELFIITEGEFKDKIESVLPTLPQSANMHFYYNAVSYKVRKMCWNQGDWRFYYFYRQWQRKTADIAREICAIEPIKVLHQLNMIGFREPGYLWKVSQETGIPFVWGPIGGLKQFPLSFAEGASIKMKFFLWLKNHINIWQLQYDQRVDKAFKQASLLISSIPDSYHAICKYKKRPSVIIPETGTFVTNNTSLDTSRFQKEELIILWVGKFDFRKKLDLAIDIIALLKEKKVKAVLRVYGSGTVEQQRQAMMRVKDRGVNECVQWKGACSNSVVKEAMQEADLFLFTSVNEDTSTVVLEAISCALPVICFDLCGMSSVIDDKVGVKIAPTCPKTAVKEFAETIEDLYHNRDKLVIMSNNCRDRSEELSWEAKAIKMVELYKGLYCS